ncbi:MAG TPA: alkaline phosphatase D family protein [Nocardioidaceae bacterium]|nr:alkaline phosphatase D family protein [Nocardioidaceae bacterium]
MTSGPLVLGPLIRYVDETSASIWVETRDSARVVVRVGERSWDARTFTVHGHHYALVEVAGLEPGTVTPYSVEVDATPVWPPPGSAYPPSVIATLKPGKPLRLAYGSCRTSVAHDAEGNGTHGVDAMRAYALRMAEGDVAWPDLLLFLGDQVYADETTAEMQEFIAARRDIDEPPGEELKDYEEYAHLYELAWSDEANRWLLSTLPSAMIFDDHDIRDDWNTSLSWKRKMEATPWWHERIVSGLASYWVYQHLGNLSPEERAEDEIWRKVITHTGDEELDLTDQLDALADRVDQKPDSYRWSYARKIGDVRLVVVDSRAARVLAPEERSILDDKELAWLDGQLRGGCRHLLVGTSLPFLLSPGLHHLEAWNEALASGAWGRRGARFGEKLRQLVDLEHWAAFQKGFQEVAAMVTEVADGRRGPAPETVTFLSGDVHHSYVSEVERSSGSRIVQAVCSPVRNPLPRSMRFATAVLSYGIAGPAGALVARSAKVPDPPFRWSGVRGPWFDNNLASLEETPDGLRLWWETGVVDGDDHAHPRLEEVAALTIAPRDS